MPAHSADGFGLEFTHRTSWKARLYKAGRVVDVVPITWVHTWRKSGDATYVEVWFKDPEEIQRHLELRERFAIALAVAKDPLEHPKTFQSFQGVFWVKSTGAMLSDQSVEAQIIGRRRATDE